MIPPEIEKAIVSGYNFQWVVCSSGFALIMATAWFRARTAAGRILSLGIMSIEIGTSLHRGWWFLATVLGPGLTMVAVTSEPARACPSPYLPWLQDHRSGLFFAVQLVIVGYMLSAHETLHWLLGKHWWAISYGASFAVFLFGASLAF